MWHSHSSQSAVRPADRPRLVSLYLCKVKMELSGSAGYFVLLIRLASFLLCLLTLGTRGRCSSCDARLILLSRRAGGSHCSWQSVFRRLPRLFSDSTQRAIPPPPRRRPDRAPSRRKSLIHVAHPPLFFFFNPVQFTPPVLTARWRDLVKLSAEITCASPRAPLQTHPPCTINLETSSD